MSDEPVRINRLHAVWPNQITKIFIVALDQGGDGWLEIHTEDGNKYQTELRSKPDPECLVDQKALAHQFKDKCFAWPAK